jgi:hypothetical protein
MPEKPDSQTLVEPSSAGNFRRFLIPLSSTLLFLALLLAASIRLTFSELQFYHDADSILPALISTVKWTWFYWGQNRLGTLLPLLAAPIHNEFSNLMFQSWLTILAGLYALLVIPGWILGRGRSRVGGLCACILFFSLFGHRAIFQYLSTGLPYAVSMALIFSAMRLTDSASKWTSHAAAFGLMCAGLWVNIGLYPLAFALLLARCALTGWSRTRLAVLVMLSAAFGLNAAGARLSSIRTPGTFGLDIGDIDDNIIPLIKSIGKHIEANAAVLAALSIIIIAAVCITLLRQRRSEGKQAAKGDWLLVLSALCGTMAFLLLLSASGWVRMNQYHVRYAVPVIIMSSAITGAVCELTARSYAGNIYARVILLASLAVILGGVLHVRFPYADSGAIRKKFDKMFGMHSESIIGEGVQVVYGDFRDVWPAVFHVRLKQQEQGIDAGILGITDRCESTQPLWRALLEKDVVSARIAKSRWPCVPPENTDYSREASFALPMVFDGERRSGTLLIGRFTLPAAPNTAAP